MGSTYWSRGKQSRAGGRSGGDMGDLYIWDDLPSLDKMDQTHFGQLNISMKFDLLEG